MEGRPGGRSRPPRASLNWRLYRLCLAPVVAAALILAFSLGGGATPLSSSLVPEAFEGSHAYGELSQMAAIAPSRRPGSSGDLRLLAYLRSRLQSLGSTSSGGYSLRTVAMQGQTTWGSAPQSLLVAHRAGTDTLAPIALIASRDSAARGARAQLSGAAALLELASVLAQGETRHPLYVIFSDAGSNGNAAIVSWLQSALGGRLDAAIVLGDLAGRGLSRPLVQPFSTGFGMAPEALTATVSAALRSAMGLQPGSPSLASQLAHLAFPLSIAQQGPLNGIGIPSVGVSLAGERGPSPSEPVSERRLQAAGRGVLSAFYAIDRAGELSTAPATGLTLSGQVLPEWPIALLILTLLLGPAIAGAEALVRISRRGARNIRRWMLLPLVCAWPFALCGLALRLLAAAGLLHAPPNPVGASALGFDAGAIAALVLAAGALGAAWWGWSKLHLAAGPRKVPGSGLAGLAVLCAGCLLAVAVWLIDPYAALLLVPALHLWLIAISPELRPRSRAALLALVAIPALAPSAALACFYAISLGLGPGQGLHEAMVMVGGGYVDWGGMLLWSAGFGLLVAMAIATLGGRRRERATPRVHPPPPERRPQVRYPARAHVYRERALH
jgi:hypothetical protein